MKSFICSVCENVFKLDRKEAKVANCAPIQFCSIECFRNFILKENNVKEFNKFFSSGILKLNPVKMQIPSDTMMYSPKLGITFRSNFERCVGETLVNWRMRFGYESFYFDSNEASAYIPDFFLLGKHKCFLEVKGPWRSGAKKKFLHAVDLIGADKMLLVPLHLYDSFKKEAEK